MLTTTVLLTAFLFAPPPTVKAEGRVTVVGVRIGVMTVRRAELDYRLTSDGGFRATGTAILGGGVDAKILYVVGDVNTGLYVAKVDAMGGRIDLTGRLADLMTELLPK